MNDKYIIYFISRTKANMIKFIENKLKENDLNDLIPTHGNILTALYESDKKLTMKEIAKKIGKDKSTVTSLVNKLIHLVYKCYYFFKRLTRWLWSCRLFSYT